MLLLQNPTLLRLFFAQALYWSCALTGVTLTALIGLQLAPANALATLPLALLALGNLLAVRPLSMYMQRHGRRPGLMLGAALGLLGGLLSALGVWLGDFVLFCLGALPIGAYQASAMFYRFAALEAVDADHRGRATAWVIAGGLLAALLAPPVALWAKNALATPYAGAYLLIAAFATGGLWLTRTLPAERAATSSPATGSRPSLLSRPVVRAALAITATGHGLMILVMNATPLAMQFCSLPVESAAQVIRWHVIGMFLPALVAGPLVDRLGSRRVALLGCAVTTASAAVALSGLAQAHFLFSSFLLGLGWNLMLIAGTTLLGEGHSADERGQAQGLMELTNGLLATGASFASAVLLVGAGWEGINLGMVPLLCFALAMLHGGRRRAVATAD